MKNSLSAYQYGDRVADALQQWIDEGIVAGPLREEDIPFADYTVSPIMVRLKPNGSARIIVNLSSPHTEGGPGSVNSGINGKEFKARMSSTQRFVGSLCRVGVGALICKSDWSSAYKHQAVREEDLKLQFIEFGGKFFVELMLVFGAISSPGIFDDLAKVVLGLALLRSKMLPALVQQHLDDVVGVGPPRDEAIFKFDQAYRDVAEMVGVRLAGREDPDKSFAPRTSGLVLGVWYDTVDFTWKIREDKVARICQMLQMVHEGIEDITVAHMLSLAGKLVDIRALVKGGKFNIGLIIGAANSRMDKAQLLEVSPALREQCYWWILNLQAASVRSPITRPDIGLAPCGLEGWTDAAGGSYEKVGHGVGGVLEDTWFYVPWPQWINKNRSNTKGVKFSRKLTCLELVGPLVMVAANPDTVRNNQLVIYVDNQGSCDIYRKGFSTSCIYSYAIEKATWEVSQALNCRLHVQKIRRCSDPGSIAADALSKAEFKTFYKYRPGMKVDPARVPTSILKWLEDPTESLGLGQKIVEELSVTTQVLCS